MEGRRNARIARDFGNRARIFHDMTLCVDGKTGFVELFVSPRLQTNFEKNQKSFVDLEKAPLDAG